MLPSETTVSEDGPPANDAAVRRELAFSSPEADKGTSSTSAGNGRARSVEPKSALKSSPSPAGHTAAEKKVRVICNDETKTDRGRSSAPPPIEGNTGCFGLLQLRKKAQQIKETGRATRREASPKVNPAAKTASVERTSSSAGAIPAAAPQTGTSFGNILGVLDAVGSQETALQLILRAAPGERVTMLGFSFDRSELVCALIGAKKRGCHVRVVLDKDMTLKGRTRDQLSSSKELVACGVLVRIAAGVPLGPEYRAVGRSVPGFLNGIQHSKAVLAGREAVIGSANWTTSSRSNWELGLHVEFAASHVDIVEEMFLGSWHAGVDLALAQITAEQQARSCSPSGRGQRR